MSAETGSVNLKEQAVNFTTMRHIERVRNLLNKMVRHLLRRGELHDQSKLEPPESPMSAQYTDQLRLLTFGSQEYSDCKKKLGPALDHHYARNPHHPEFHKNGVADMNLIDLMEMICDWKAASDRHADGDIYRSLKINKERFGISDQLAQILTNTVNFLFPATMEEGPDA